MPQNRNTVFNHLRAVLKRAENWDCTSQAEDQAIRHAMDAVARSLNSRELATVLAALRTWQAGAEGYLPCDQRKAIGEIADNGGTLDPLTEDEIDALCERLNC